MGGVSQAPEPSVLRLLGDDVRHVWTVARRDGFWHPIKRTSTELQEFYLSPERRLALTRMGRVRRFFKINWWLLKGLLRRLTPARRLLLLAGLIMTVVSVQQVTIGSQVRIGNGPLIPLALICTVLMLELKDKLLARDELQAGQAVQRALLPSTPPVIAGWDVALFTRPANDVGGDLVDWQQIDDRRCAVAIGDVAGKGLPAALMMAKLQATLRALAQDIIGVDDLGRRVNRIFVRDGLRNSFTTLVYLELASDTGEVAVLNAGHMPPLIVRGDAVTELPRGGAALGLLASSAYTPQQARLGQGDYLIVYTDGVTEAMDAATDFFGDERLLALLTSLGTLTSAQVVDRIVRAVDAFVGTAPAHDDISLIVLRRTT